MTDNADSRVNAASRLQRQMKAFGLTRMPLELQVEDDRIVVAGPQVFAVPKHVSFHEFLISYALNRLGKEWSRLYLLEQSSAHPLANHFLDGLGSVQPTARTLGSLREYKINGEMYAFLTFAYDLFTLADNARVHDTLLCRVRNPDQFQGVRYEIYVAASLLRAGFSIEFEDESDSHRSHCEFTATFRTTKKSFSVEAKSRHRDVATTGEKQRLKAGVYRLLQEALLKSANHERIIFADVNLPPDNTSFPHQDWHLEVMSTLSELEHKQRRHDPWPQSIVFFTNRKTAPWKGSDDRTSTVILTAINHDLITIRDRTLFEGAYPEIGKLFHAAMSLSSPPGEFFGQVMQSFIS